MLRSGAEGKYPKQDLLVTNNKLIGPRGQMLNQHELFLISIRIFAYESFVKTVRLV